MAPSYVLVTGATGFIGAHVVNALLLRGYKVRGATRSHIKAQAMLAARPQYASKLDFVEISDFATEGGKGLEDAVRGIDGVIHVASPFTYDTTDNEKELIIPAINGVRSILSASAQNPDIKRVVITSSFASVIDLDRNATSKAYFTYTAKDWNPLTYAEAADPATNAVVAYRGSKKFAELEAWKFLEENKPGFELVTLCPPMTFGPIVHPISSIKDLNESNAMLWQVATGVEPMPVARVPFWVDVRDLANAHVMALVAGDAGGKRFTVASPERFSYGLAREVLSEAFEWVEMGEEKKVEQAINESYGLDGETAGRELGVQYIEFKECVIDLVGQVRKMQDNESG